jgi:CheY-like chemotaxis protein/HPt (histidine-containing phosphotransfer) domain-containing protein
VEGAADIRILLVEDYPINREVTVAILNKIGFSDITIAENGQVAVDMFRRKTAFDLILMDIQMPVMDGCEATGHIRRMENGAGRVPIIAMTANALEGDRENYLAAGMDDYISKPVRKEGLIEVLGRWTNKNQTQVPAQKTVFTDTEDASFGRMVFNSEDTMSRYDDDSEVVRMIIEKFIEQTPGTIKEIETAIESENSARAGSRAHALKGGAAYIGAERVRKIAFDMENSKNDKSFQVGEITADQAVWRQYGQKSNEQNSCRG